MHRKTTSGKHLTTEKEGSDLTELMIQRRKTKNHKETFKQLDKTIKSGL